MVRLLAMIVLVCTWVSCTVEMGEFSVDAVDGGVVEQGKSRNLSIHGGPFGPSVQRDIGCGGGPLVLAQGYDVQVALSDEAPPRWILLEDTRVVDAVLLRTTVSDRLSAILSPGVYDLRVTDPWHRRRVLPRGVRVISGADVADGSETDTADTGADTGADVVDTDTDTAADTDTDVVDTGADTGADTAADTDTDVVDTDTDTDTGECVVGDTRCIDASYVSVCGADSHFGIPHLCAYYCDVAGSDDCAGECVPGETRCQDSHLLSECQVTYVWDVGVHCPGGCRDGTCVPLVGKHVYALKAEETMTVDARLDESIWDVSEEIAKVVHGTSDNSAAFDVVWDDVGLHVGVLVDDGSVINDSSDDAPWDDDSIEVYIDGNNNKGPYDEYDNYYIRRYASPTLWTYSGTGSDVEHEMINWGVHYIVEMTIPWFEMGFEPVSGQTIGFDIRVNDDDLGGPARGALIWNGDGTARTSTSMFGHLTFIEQGLYPNEPEVNNCGAMWTVQSDQLDDSFLISWEAYGDTLDGGYDSDCAIGERDVYFWVSTPAHTTIDIALEAGFDNIVIRQIRIAQACPDVMCDPVPVPSISLTLHGGDVPTWTRVAISAVGATRDMSIVRFTRR